MSRRPAVRCSATSTRTGEQCRRYAMHGTNVCPVHGGRAPQVRRAAERRLAEAKATRAAVRHLSAAGATPIVNPLEALQELASEVVALKDYFRGEVERLQEIRYRGTAGEQLRAEVALYERALDRCARTLVELGRLNIDQRLAAIDEARGLLVVEALEEAMRTVPLDRSTSNALRVALSGALRSRAEVMS